jgi:K+-sensing histidine kinase KdpD
VAEVARRRGITYVLLGSPTVRRGPSRFRTSLIERMIEAMPGVDIRIVSDRSRMDPSNQDEPRGS